jgi:hypothetical protein
VADWEEIGKHYYGKLPPLHLNNQTVLRLYQPRILLLENLDTVAHRSQIYNGKTDPCQPANLHGSHFGMAWSKQPFRTSVLIIDIVIGVNTKTVNTFGQDCKMGASIYGVPIFSHSEGRIQQ